MEATAVNEWKEKFYEQVGFNQPYKHDSLLGSAGKHLVLSQLDKMHECDLPIPRDLEPGQWEREEDARFMIGEYEFSVDLDMVDEEGDGAWCVRRMSGGVEGPPASLPSSEDMSGMRIAVAIDMADVYWRDECKDHLTNERSKTWVNPGGNLVTTVAGRQMLIVGKHGDMNMVEWNDHLILTAAHGELSVMSTANRDFHITINREDPVYKTLCEQTGWKPDLG